MADPPSEPYRAAKPLAELIPPDHRRRNTIVLVAASVIVGAVGLALSQQLWAVYQFSRDADAPPIRAPEPLPVLVRPSLPEMIDVLVTVDPADAQVGLGDGQLQPQPVKVTLGVRSEVTLHIERKGYTSRVITLRGSEIDPKMASRAYTLEREPAAEVGGTAPFDRGAAALALGKVDVQSCRTPDGPTGVGHVTLNFVPSGQVAAAIIDSGPFSNTPVGACIAAKFRNVLVPAFSGADKVAVGKSFTVNRQGPRPSDERL